MKKINPAERGEVVHLNNYRESDSTTHSIPRKSCLCCGYRFIPSQTYHRLCGTCYGYTKAGYHLQAAARLLRGVRS